MRILAPAALLFNLIMNKKRTIIIGIDGVPFELMADLSDRGVMPNFGRLRERGVFSKMRSAIPEISSVAWSSIITGKNPGEHGIFGFTEIIPGSYALSFPDFSSLKQPAFWHKNPDKKCVILNVPSTYPAKELNGVHVSGFISLDLERAVRPITYLPELNQMNYQVDVDSALAHESMDLFLKKLTEANEARIKAYRHFWQKENWDVFMLVFTGSDRLGHFLWSAYQDQGHQYHQAFLAYFRRVDEIIGEINSQLNPADLLVLLSDHGMAGVEKNFNVNYFLGQADYLKLDRSLNGYNQITAESRAFALDPARIYLHLAGKYPKGQVKPEEKENLIKELIDLFKKVNDNGRPVIRGIYRKEEIYYGQFFASAPDLVLVPNSGYRLKGNIGKNILFEKDIFTGDHTLDNAFLYVKDKANAIFVPERPTVEDVQMIINKIINK